MNLKKFNFKDWLEKSQEIYSKLEVDGHYGEQCNFEDALDILLEKTIRFPQPRRVWEGSKRILDIKEDEKWMIKTKAKR